MKLSTLISASLLALAAGTALAQPNTPRVDQREANQSARIAQGAASGALTGHERRRLAREQRAIQNAEQKAKADGVVTPRERRALHRAQDAASRDIYRQKHDGQVKP